MVNAAEHFDWAITRATEHLDQNQAGNAMASLVSDFNKHPGTAGILTSDLQLLMTGEILVGGARGLRRFIEGIPRPVDHSACSYADKPVRCDRCGREYVCTPADDFYCAAEGDHCCERCLIGDRELHTIMLPPDAAA